MHFRILLSFFLLTSINLSFCFSQTGFSFAYSTNKVLTIDLNRGNAKNRFHIGYGYQFNGQKKTVVRERKPTYGLTKIESGDFLRMIDLGYSRIFKNKFSFNPEVSIVSKKIFTSYEDDRFSDNGYSLITKSENKIGFGLNIGVILGEGIEPFIGYHTFKKLNLGVRFTFSKK